LTLESFRIGPLSIPSIYYLPNFLTNEEEKSILKCIYAYPSETIKENEPNIWVQLKNRRLQMWGGIVKIPFEPVPLPKWLQQITKSLVEAGIFAFDHEPNHVLINGLFVSVCLSLSIYLSLALYY
jgi:alkylated DNA repair protein alkB family protein 6